MAKRASEIKLEALKKIRADNLLKKLDSEIRGYDHLIDIRKDNIAVLRSDWVDENIRILITKYNYQIGLINKLLIRDFTTEEINQYEAENL
jgi:hypothetical protein|tara:strand:- start:9884 stop:10156 length:273 start_codon:yes stop_codon:yes gene_type:complete